MLNYNYYNIDIANDIIACDLHMTITYTYYNLYTVTVYSKYSYPVYYDAVNSWQVSHTGHYIKEKVVWPVAMRD